MWKVMAFLVWSYPSSCVVIWEINRIKNTFSGWGWEAGTIDSAHGFSLYSQIWSPRTATADTMRLTCISHLSLKSPSHTHTPNTKKHLESITGFSIPEIAPRLWRCGTGSKEVPGPRNDLFLAHWLLITPIQGSDSLINVQEWGRCCLL